MQNRFFLRGRHIGPVGALFTLLLASSPTRAGDTPAPVESPRDTTPWGATITAGGLENDWQAGAELLAPLVYKNDTLIYLYPEFGTYDSGRQSYSIGIGARRYIESLDAIVGLNAFYDHTESDYDNDINQFGLGAEWMSRFFDARFNYYLPDDDQFLIDSKRTTESSRSSESHSFYGNPYASGNSVLQPYIKETTTTTRTTRRKFDRFEAGMEGIDTEIGIDAPFIKNFTDLKLFGGYYNYDNPFAGDIEGFKARAEWRVSDHLTVDVAYYEDDELFGGNVYGGVRVHIPIGKVSSPASYESSSLARELGAKQPVSAKVPVAKAAPKDTIRHRMTENIIRTPRAITTTSDYREDIDARHTTVRHKTKSKTVATHTIAEDLVFVNNGGSINGLQAGSSHGDGTAEAPVDTIQQGVNIAASGTSSTVYAQGGGPAYVEDVNIVHTDVNLVGSGTGIAAKGGKAFGGGQEKPVILGGIGAIGGASLGVSSFTIRQGRSSNVAGATAGSQGYGAGIYTESVGQVNVTNNMINNTVGDGVEITSSDFNDDIRAVVSNNMVDGAGGDGIELAGDRDVNINSARINNNVITDATESGIRVATASNSSEDILDTVIDGNSIDAPGQNGIAVEAEDDAYAKITNNTVTNQRDNSRQGILVDVADFYGEITDNNVSDSAGWGMTVQTADNYDGAIERNNVTNSGGKGISVVLGSDFLGQFVSNFSDNAAFEAIEFRTVTGTFSGDFSDNTGNNSTTGIRTDVGAGAFGVTTGNFASGNGTNFDLSPAGFGGP